MNLKNYRYILFVDDFCIIKKLRKEHTLHSVCSKRAKNKSFPLQTFDYQYRGYTVVLATLC